jgi:O-succinylbenzoic acid--CoA ligase
VGKPLPHVELRLDGEGRILLRGESLARYCLDERGWRPLLDEQGWLATGDLGRLDGEGRLWILGRGDELLITGGEKVHPAAIEAELEACPGLREVAVVGVEDARWGERLVACYCGDLSPAELEAWSRGRLKGAYCPRQFLRLEALPRNALGKLLRRELGQLVRARLQPPSFSSR